MALKPGLDEKIAEKESAQSKLDEIQKKLDAANTELADATKIRVSAEQARDSALTASSASTEGNGDFSATATQHSLDSKATKEVADAVSEMVSAVLAKQYHADTCMAMLNSKASYQAAKEANLQESYTAVLKACLKLVTEGVTTAAAREEQVRSNLLNK